MARTGRPLAYETAEALEKAVDAYFRRISYPAPAVVATPTGEVDEQGRVKWATRMLTTQKAGMGDPVLVTKWLEPPSVAGLCLALGISRDTWWRYAKKPAYREAAERARLRMEAYWVAKLESKANKGAAFALENAFGWKGDWKARQETGLDAETGKALGVEAYLRKEAKKAPEPYEY